MKIIKTLKEILKIIFEDFLNNDDCKYSPKFKSWKRK